jgi:hypothetical protein
MGCAPLRLGLNCTSSFAPEVWQISDSSNWDFEQNFGWEEVTETSVLRRQDHNHNKKILSIRNHYIKVAFLQLLLRSGLIIRI